VPDSPYKTQQWRTLRPVIYQRDRGMCQTCDTPHPVAPDAYDVDHIVPWNEGGSWFDPTNLRTSCRRGNRGRWASRYHKLANINRTTATAPSRDW
jgi:5-methylcytosine-specific restriction endonuclease McrA